MHDGTAIRFVQLGKNLTPPYSSLDFSVFVIKGLQKQNYRSDSAPPLSVFFAVSQYEGQTDSVSIWKMN